MALAQFKPSCFSSFACCSDGNGRGVGAAPQFSAAAAMFAEIGYDFVAQGPPIATFGGGAQNAPPYFGFVLHRILFQSPVRAGLLEKCWDFFEVFGVKQTFGFLAAPNHLPTRF